MQYSRLPSVAPSLFSFLFLFFLSNAGKARSSGSQIFDVTQFGASHSANENSKAFLAAWRAACHFEGAARMVIPSGTFMLGPVELKGPCHNGGSPSVEIRGTLRSLAGFSNKHWIKFDDLNGLSVGGGGVLDGQGLQTWDRSKCEGHHCKLSATSLKFNRVTNSKVFGLHLINSKAFHINFHNCRGIEAGGLDIRAPGTSRNTDGIHVAASSNVSITDSTIATGDDCVSIGQGARNVVVANIVCGPGHGISVGSLGKYEDESDVVGLVVKNCTIKRTTNGLRIKTWPGSPASRARDITFEDVKMIDVSNPIIIDQNYCPVDDCSSKPSKVQISDVKFRRIRGTSRTNVAVNLLCSKEVPCSNIELDDIKLVKCSDGEGYCSSTISSCSNVRGKVLGTQVPAPCNELI